MRLLTVLLLIASPLLAGAQRNALPAGRFNQPGTYALTRVSVIDGTGAQPKRNQTLLVERGRITFVGAAADAKIPPAAEVLDLGGHTVFPGLVAMHEHLHNEASVTARLWLAGGVTTVRTAGAFNPTSDFNLRQWIRDGRTAGPELFLSGPFLSEHHPNIVRIIELQELRDAEHARRVVGFWSAEGFDAIKVYRGMTPAMLRVVVDEAHRLGRLVLGHLQQVTCTQAAEIGIDSIEHGVTRCVDELTPIGGPRVRDPDAPAVRKLFATLVKHNVAISETPVDLRPLTEAELAVLHAGSRDDYTRLLAADAPGPGTRTVDDTRQGAPGLAKAFVAAGGRIFLGSDSGGVPRIPGFSNVRSLKLLYSNYGFDPLEAIRIATLEGAKFLRIDGRTGSIATGKEADLVVVKGDPSVRMRDVENIELVFTNGVLHRRSSLLESVKGLYRFGTLEHSLPR